ncbi:MULTISPECIES: YMGG-like glycine zipper-containing protein [unclassified Roseibium]|uniref:YMGG-like glycine zipper-containing protein n=1 Tax=unclassified Roseibium TaxID=2629323 RepID=UPI00273D98C6|nr:MULTISPECIES: YMGG-like glycine zipper-containing protein [unclassified Roseibium]
MVKPLTCLLVAAVISGLAMTAEVHAGALKGAVIGAGVGAIVGGRNGTATGAITGAIIGGVTKNKRNCHSARGRRLEHLPGASGLGRRQVC